MKDYRLSEIKNHDWNVDWEVSDDISKKHRECEFLRGLQHDLGIYDIVELEPRDTINLPCIIPVELHTIEKNVYQVLYRDEEYGYVKETRFVHENAAKDFINDLTQNGKK